MKDMTWESSLDELESCCLTETASGLAVGLGAFGAHVLKARLTEYALGVFETGVRYQMYHGLGLLFIGLLMERRSLKALEDLLSIHFGYYFIFVVFMYLQ